MTYFSRGESGHELNQPRGQIIIKPMVISSFSGKKHESIQSKKPRACYFVRPPTGPGYFLLSKTSEDDVQEEFINIELWFVTGNDQEKETNEFLLSRRKFKIRIISVIRNIW